MSSVKRRKLGGAPSSVQLKERKEKKISAPEPVPVAVDSSSSDSESEPEPAAEHVAEEAVTKSFKDLVCRLLSIYVLANNHRESTMLCARHAINWDTKRRLQSKNNRYLSPSRVVI